MRSIVVFCGSADGYAQDYREVAYDLGATLAKRNIRLIYGGACIGLMGAVADGVLDNKGKVIGVIPSFLRSKEIAHEEVSEMIVVESMHERKLKMHELSDGVITMPGGWGTMEEMFEMLTWAQLGLHGKPVGLLNVNGYYDSLISMINNMTDEGFLKENNRQMLLVSESIDELLEQMEQYQAPEAPKWITKQTT